MRYEVCDPMHPTARHLKVRGALAFYVLPRLLQISRLVSGRGDHGRGRGASGAAGWQAAQLPAAAAARRAGQTLRRGRGAAPAHAAQRKGHPRAPPGGAPSLCGAQEPEGARSVVGLDTAVETLLSHLVTRKSNSPVNFHGRHMSVSNPMRW
eukprot:1196421-Prorocentrum_minimum.AAC.6